MAAGGWATVTAQAEHLPVADGPGIAVLAVTLDVEARGVSPSGAVDWLVDDGLDLVTGEEWVPRPVPGWSVEVGTSTMRVFAPDGSVAYAGQVETWPDWRRDALANASVLVYVGELALGPKTSVMNAVRAAAAEGLVAGGLVAAWVTAGE